MKHFLLLIASLFICSSSFAVTDQITAAEHFLHQNNNILIDKTFSSTIDNVNVPQAVAPKKEIKFNQKSSALIPYQTQNGLTVTGIFDEETLQFIQNNQEKLGFNITKTLDYNTWYATYNQSEDWKKSIISNSLTQWQNILMKQSFANTNHFIVVDIPSMTLHAYTFDTTSQLAFETLTSKVVIGKLSTETPMDDFSIWAIKYNPTWTPTPNILKKNLYKNGQLNTSWLTSHHIRGINSEGKVVPFSSLGKGENIRLVQPAGNNNALGILKFETTSNDNIYLHDTNEKRLFSHNTRAYSSGCIRVESFKELAQWLLNIDAEQLDKKLKNANTRIEKIEMNVPVYFTYSQVIFINGQPVFSPDIYNKNNNTSFIP